MGLRRSARADELLDDRSQLQIREAGARAKWSARRMRESNGQRYEV